MDELAGEEVYDLFQRGRRLLADNHPGPASIVLERAKRLAPDKNSIREALGRAYFNVGHYERAEREFRLIVERVPTNDYAVYALGRTLLKLGRLNEARGFLRLAVAMSPDNGDYRQALATCLQR